MGPSIGTIALQQRPEKTPEESIQHAENTALQSASDEELEALASPAKNMLVTTDGLDQWATRAATAVAVLEQQRRRYDDKSAVLIDREDAVERRKRAKS
jgi:hypothetical protein